MRSPFQTPFAAIFQNEVLLNSKRMAPYALMVLFSANAVLWWGWGPAVERGWATNSDFYIHRNFGAFSFILGLPIFTALIVGDPVIRDFRLGIDPLIFSKPVSRAGYLLGKFFGSFFVLVCCQAAFALTLLLLQFLHTSHMIVLPFRVFPYFKHFFFIVVISHLVLAAVYFTAGTLTRNAKIVYGLAASFYPFYIAYQEVLLKGLPLPWRTLLDPLGFNSGQELDPWHRSADYLNQYVVRYSSDMYANRGLMILITAVCLAIVYFRFTINERRRNVEKVSVLNLSPTIERVYYDSDSLQETHRAQHEKAESNENVILPSVTRASEGFWATLKKLIPALGVEFRLLRTERSLVVLMPLAIFLSTLNLAFYQVVPEVSYSATYASGTANALLLFLFGMTVFYTGEAMYRDREMRIEPVLWAVPAPNNVLLLSKFFATLLLTLSLIVLVGLTAVVIQFLKGHAPVEIQTYLITYSVILLPSIVFMTGVSIALNVMLRNKYLAYVVSVGTGAALFYLYSQGYNHWLYNPVLYGLWTPTDLTSAGKNLMRILIQRLYCLAIAAGLMAVAHLFFERKSTRRLQTDGRLSGRGWSVLIVAASTAVAVIAGLAIGARR